MISHSTCPLCSSGKISLYLNCTDHLLSMEEFDLCKCSECGFIFTGQYPEEQNIRRYYESDDYISHNDKAKGFLNRIYLQARSIMLKRKRRMVEKTTGIRKGRILDFGCGTGYFAAEMKKSGWDVTGIEPNTKARDFASGQFGLDVKSPEQISGLTTGSFDCITMWHVLEHFHDPFGYSAEIKRLLKPGGLCLCALPNCSSFDAKHYRESWAAYDVPRHLWHFTPAAFRVFAEKTSFRITGIRSLPLDVFYISILSEKNKGSHFPFFKGMIKGSLFGFRSLFDKFKSSSLIYFLR
ncbi:MAG: class I SAM-dependent methyltransferase [Bacteroidia bacterium]|nr:MAG: class I SAM-dependent methyltransferase [Bacteroidia bacterium]